MDIPPALLTGAGWVGSVIILYWLLATERLVTGASHRRELADKDARIAELVADRDATVAKQDKTIEVKDAQIERLSVVGEAFLKIMTSIEALGRKGPG